MSLGALAGGWALGALPAWGGSAFATLFYASTVLRALAALAFRRLVREVRPVRQFGLREVVLDLVGQRLVGVLGFFSVKPELESGRRGSGGRGERGRRPDAEPAPEPR